MRQTGLIQALRRPAPLPKEQRETTIRLVLRPLDKPAEHNKASRDSAMAAQAMRQRKKTGKGKTDADAFASKYGIGTDSPAKEAARWR